MPAPMIPAHHDNRRVEQARREQDVILNPKPRSCFGVPLFQELIAMTA